MSLDLSGKAGVAKMAIANAVTGNLSTLAVGDFTIGSDAEVSNRFIVFVDTTAGNITITPSTSLNGLESGDVMKVIKSDNSVNRLLFTDPDTGANIGYVNRQYESMTLVYDGTAWGFDF